MGATLWPGEACLIAWRSACRRSAGMGSAVLLDEHKRPFHVHGGDDEPEIAGVAGAAAIADAAYAVPLLHRAHAKARGQENPNERIAQGAGASRGRPGGHQDHSDID